MRSESGVKGLKLTSGVWLLLPPLSVTALPACSAVLNRATRLLDAPTPEPRALDNRLWRKTQKWMIRKDIPV